MYFEALFCTCTQLRGKQRSVTNYVMGIESGMQQLILIKVFYGLSIKVCLFVLFVTSHQQSFN